MKKKKCVECMQKKGKRSCKKNNDEFICPLCCGMSRNPDCKECRYYEESKIYDKIKSSRYSTKPFIAEINEEVDNIVDQALSFVEKGNIKKGEAIISELLKDHPGNHTIFFGLGVVHAFKEEFDEAIKYFDKAIDIFPLFAEAHLNKATAYQKKMDLENMIKSYKEVVAVGNPNDNIVKQAKGILVDMELHTLKTYEIDLETYIKCEAIYKNAFSCMEKKEWVNAIKGFKACLSKNKKHPQSYGNLGICYAKLGQKDLALEALHLALEIDPNYEPAIINKIAVESLQEGEKLDSDPNQSIEYYKEYPLKKKSLIKDVYKKMTDNDKTNEI